MTVSREELYELVWASPMTEVATRFDVSASYLARVCTALRVPRPGRGYWAKVEAGGHPRVTALPAQKAGHPLEWTRDGLPHVPRRQSLPTQLGEEAIANPQREATQVKGVHSLISGARKHFENTRDIGEDGYLKPFKKQLVDITVSKQSLVEALRIASTLFNALESVGYNVLLGHPSIPRLSREELEVREKPSKRGNYATYDLWRPDRPTVVYAENAVIGLVLVEMKEEVPMRNVGGRYVREADYVPPKRGQPTAHTWTFTREIPCARYRLIAYAASGLLTWSTQWQHADNLPLVDQIPAIVQAMKGIAVDLERRTRAAQVEHEIRRREWEAEHERMLRADDQALVRASEKESSSQLEQIIQSWARASNVKAFFDGVEAAADNLVDSEKGVVLERLKLAREFIGNINPLAHFLAWKTPSERYQSKYGTAAQSEKEDTDR